MDDARPPDLGARLLLTECDALLPILRRTPANAFARPTVCTGRTVREVLARCGAALTRRRPDPARIRLDGADPAHYHLFR
jgi:hypothetical protein